MSEIRFTLDGAVARLTLNTPARHNALTRKDVERFLEENKVEISVADE